MNVTVRNEKLMLVVLQQSKRLGLSQDETVEHFMRLGLAAERERILAERAAKAAAPEAEATRQIIRDPCTEEFLRDFCGEDWVACWWLSTCALAG